MSQARAPAAPKRPAAAGGRGFKAELESVRERMRALGFGPDETAAEVSRRYQVRPRQAYRLAWGWTLDQAAARFNEHAASDGTDPQGRASMTGSHLCEVEQWPGSSRKPSVYVLCQLAAAYQTDALRLLDLADHESLPPQDRLILTRRPGAQTPFGARVLALAGARGLSLRELARLDDLLEAAGELAALADAAGAAAGGSALGAGHDPGRPVEQEQAVGGAGMSLTLPYVPARLVIEVYGPTGSPGLLAGDGQAAPARLTLVQDHSPGTTGTEATGL